MVYERLMLEILVERGAPRGEALQAAGIRPDEDARADGRFSLEQCVRLVLHALSVTGDAGLGYELGLRLIPSAHGVLGFAAMTGASLSEALAVASKYIRTRLPQFRLTISREGDCAVMELRETLAIPLLRAFFFECVLVGFAQSATLICQEPPDLEIWFDWPKPSYYERYRTRLPRISFDRPANQIRCPAALLTTRLVFSNEEAHREALAQVQREALVLGDDDDVADVAVRTRAALRWSPRGYASLTSTAERLGVSPRTLRRKLASSGLSYRALLDEARYRDARDLLETSDLDLADISARLGFENPPSFTRAFKQWAKTTPSDYRARLRHPSSI
jgi:AraC-like DNA-binding protein